MNILIPDSWLREFLHTDATVDDIKKCLTLCGPSVEKIEKRDNDYIYHIEITSNRIDTASVYGIAREAKAILPQFDFKATLKEINPDPILKGETLPLTVEDKSGLCDRLMAVALTNVSVSASSQIICERLEKSGVRTLNNLIDITNYVMLELGHPIHVFDYDRIKTNRLVIRKAKNGEKIITLDKKEHVLNMEDIVIDDGTGRIIDLPGIMGTQNSVVTPQTKRILLFIESNNPTAIRKTSMRLGLRTMAATINEKHPDPELAKTAFMRGLQLYQKETCSQVASNIIDIYPHPKQIQSVCVSCDHINRQLGIKLTEEKIVSILNALDFTVQTNQGNLTATPPSYRGFDINIAQDIVEEVARLYGYHNLQTQLMSGEIPVKENEHSSYDLGLKIKYALKYWGYTEIYTYSMISCDLINKCNLATSQHLRLNNPLTADIEYMRISLVPSMLQTVNTNQNHTNNLQHFELAKIYVPQKGDLPHEQQELLIADSRGYRELKGTVSLLLKESGINRYHEKSTSDWKFGHPKQTSAIYIDDQILVNLGTIHPQLTDRFMLKKNIYLAQINFDLLLKHFQSIKKYTPIPNFPAVVEDLTINIPENIQISCVLKDIGEIDALIAGIDLIDAYKQSYTVKLRYQHINKNLSDQDVKIVREKIFRLLKEKYDITIKQS